jgi:hypothetical protein
MTDAHKPANYDRTTLYAIRACFDGKASEGQQKAAMEWIVNEVCGLRDLSYRPGDALATAFAEGKRWAGLQIAGMLFPPALKRVEAAEAAAQSATTKRQTRGTKPHE